jgi:5-methylcytosine-specific restriction endonuclease McrA
MRGRTGALHHLYLGGKIWWRGKEWDDRKLEVKTRDGFKCVQCGRTEAEQLELVGMPLSVDHIIMYRISHDNSMENLQTLCSSCHGKKIPEERALVDQCREILAA